MAEVEESTASKPQVNRDGTIKREKIITEPNLWSYNFGAWRSIRALNFDGRSAATREGPHFVHKASSFPLTSLCPVISRSSPSILFCSVLPRPPGPGSSPSARHRGQRKRPGDLPCHRGANRHPREGRRASFEGEKTAALFHFNSHPPLAHPSPPPPPLAIFAECL